MKALLLFLLICTACSHNTPSQESALMNLQIIDRNGFAETISSKDRLGPFENIDFNAPQPYQKVVRVFGKTSQGEQISTITTYHPNGQLYQYLDTQNGRAYGFFREWFPSGHKKLECRVIEGTPDISELAQTSWVFDKTSFVWDEEEHLIAEIHYDKGSLEGPSSYYHKNGHLEKIIPYKANLVHGTVSLYRESGELLESINYTNDLKHGTACGYKKDGSLRYQEEYTQDLLMTASYFDTDGKTISSISSGSGRQALFDCDTLISLIDYQKGLPEGKVEIFSPTGHLLSFYHILNGQKSGEEITYYTNSLTPKISLQWHDDIIQGIVKTWYENGNLESQKEMSGNKKHGLSFAWYQDGGLMFMEEYDMGVLVKGSYLKKGDKKPVSKVENGKGIATLYDSKGHFQKKISYEKGLPHLEDK